MGGLTDVGSMKHDLYNGITRKETVMKHVGQIRHRKAIERGIFSSLANARQATIAGQCESQCRLRLCCASLIKSFSK